MTTTLPWRGPTGLSSAGPSSATSERLARRALNAEWHAHVAAGSGALGYFVERSAAGRPLILLHGIHAAASAYDVRPLFQAFRSARPVFALDLPGFGSSSREPGEYSPAVYASSIERFVSEVATAGDSEACDVVALSLSCEFVARAAVRAPGGFRKLVFISPTGLGASRHQGALRRAARHTMATLLSIPPFGAAAFRLLASRPGVEYSLSRCFAGGVDPGFVEHAIRTSRVAGAHHAPLALATSKPTSPDAFALYSELRCPTLIVYDEDPNTGFEKLPALLSRNSSVTAQRVSPSRGLPHFDCPARTARIIRDFLA